MPKYNLASLLETSAEAYPDRTALVLGDTRLSYAQLNAGANQVANLLVSRGIKPGEKVALLLPNLPYFTVLYYGILKAGAIAVPMNVLFKEREIAYHLADSEAVALFAFEGSDVLPIAQQANAAVQEVAGIRDFFIVTADPAAASPIEAVQTFGAAVAGQSPSFETVETDEEDTAVILYTSGTTGRPKGAELRHRNMRDNALVTKELFGADAANPDTFLAVLPLFHTFGQTVIQNAGLAFGGTIVMLPRFDATAAIATMLAEKVSFFAGVPTMYWGLLAALDESVDVATLAANLRMAAAGGSALPVEIHRKFEEKFGVVIAEGYGLSETSPVAAFKPFGAPARPGSIGTQIPGVELKLIEPSSWEEIDWTPDAIGEIAVKGNNVFKGYYNRPEATAEALRPDGWFRTGDLAKRDADDWYYIVDRSKDMIIRNGFNVYPREVEEVLMTHPAVSLAAVIGVPHEEYGEEIKAVLVLAPDAAVSSTGSPAGSPTASGEDVSAAVSAEIREWAKGQLANYKYPRLIEVVDALPMTATGKILKRELN